GGGLSEALDLSRITLHTRRRTALHTIFFPGARAFPGQRRAPSGERWAPPGREVSLRRDGERLTPSMADPDVDAVERFYAAWTAGDLPAMLAEVDPEVEAEPVLGLLFERPTYRGHLGITDWFEEIVDLWDSFEAHVE